MPTLCKNTVFRPMKKNKYKNCHYFMDWFSEVFLMVEGRKTVKDIIEEMRRELKSEEPDEFEFFMPSLVKAKPAKRGRKKPAKAGKNKKTAKKGINPKKKTAKKAKKGKKTASKSRKKAKKAVKRKPAKKRVLKPKKGKPKGKKSLKKARKRKK